MIHKQKLHKNKIPITFSYYLPKSKSFTNQLLYEKRLAPKEAQTFRTKKTPIFNDLNYTSRQNPLSTNKNHRFDKSYKETHERKKKVPFISDKQTDPVSLRYEPPNKTSNIRPQFRNTTTLDVQMEKKFELPAARVLSVSNKRYKLQIGLSSSLQKLPRTRETMNSSSMEGILKYASAKHEIEKVTDKVGSKYG